MSKLSANITWEGNRSLTESIVEAIDHNSRTSSPLISLEGKQPSDFKIWTQPASDEAVPCIITVSFIEPRVLTNLELLGSSRTIELYVSDAENRNVGEYRYVTTFRGGRVSLSLPESSNSPLYHCQWTSTAPQSVRGFQIKLCSMKEKGRLYLATVAFAGPVSIQSFRRESLHAHASDLSSDLGDIKQLAASMMTSGGSLGNVLTALMAEKTRGEDPAKAVTVNPADIHTIAKACVASQTKEMEARIAQNMFYVVQGLQQQITAKMEEVMQKLETMEVRISEIERKTLPSGTSELSSETSDPSISTQAA